MEWRAEKAAAVLAPDSIECKFWFITFCIHFLLLCNQLTQIKQFKTIPVHYLPVSIGQKSRHIWAGFSAQSFTRLQSRCQLGWIPFWGWGLSSTCDCWQNSLPWGCMTEAPSISGCWLGMLKLLRLPTFLLTCSSWTSKPATESLPHV